MKLKKNFLYTKLEENNLIEYSKFKFGEVGIIDHIAKIMSKIILNEISNNKKYVLYTTNKFPTKSYYKKNSLLLTEKISKILNLPLIIGEYKYNYQKNEFYDNQIKRKIHLPKINKGDKLKYGGGNYIFLMIDDSIFTGTTLKVSLNELKNVTNEVIFFSVINLNKNNYSEKEANNMCFKKNGVKIIANILNDKHYIFTTHMLRFIESLNKQKLSLFFNKMNKKKKMILLKSFKEYIEKELIL